LNISFVVTRAMINSPYIKNIFSPYYFNIFFGENQGF